MADTVDFGKSLVAEGLVLVEKRKEKRLQKLMTDYQNAQETARKARVTNIFFLFHSVPSILFFLIVFFAIVFSIPSTFNVINSSHFSSIPVIHYHDNTFHSPISFIHLFFFSCSHPHSCFSFNPFIYPPVLYSHFSISFISLFHFYFSISLLKVYYFSFHLFFQFPFIVSINFHENFQFTN